MKKIATSLALVALTLTAFSCKGKDDAPVTPTPVTPSVTPETPKGIDAPFVDKTYAITYLSEDKTIVYRTELTLRADSTLSGTNTANDEVEQFSGKYTYDATTGKLSFSDLKIGETPSTAEELYLDQDPSYDAKTDQLHLGGAYYRLASLVEKLQPQTPAPQPVEPTQPTQPTQPEQPVTPPAGAPAFVGKVYAHVEEEKDESGAITASSRETLLLKADGSFEHRILLNGELLFADNGRYSYDPTTHALVFSDLTNLEGKPIQDGTLESYNEDAPHYAPDQNAIYFRQTYFKLSN